MEWMSLIADEMQVAPGKLWFLEGTFKRKWTRTVGNRDFLTERCSIALEIAFSSVFIAPPPSFHSSTSCRSVLCFTNIRLASIAFIVVSWRMQEPQILPGSSLSYPEKLNYTVHFTKFAQLKCKKSALTKKKNLTRKQRKQLRNLYWNSAQRSSYQMNFSYKYPPNWAARLRCIRTYLFFAWLTSRSRYMV